MAGFGAPLAPGGVQPVSSSSSAATVAASDATNTADDTTLLQSILNGFGGGSTAAPTVSTVPWYEQPLVWIVGALILLLVVVFR